MSYIRELCLISSLLISGCAIRTLPYEAPSNTHNVKFNVENRLIEPMFVHAYSDAKECRGRSIISFLQSQRSTAVYIQADKEFAFSLTALVPNFQYCKMAASFKPEKGYEYFSTMEHDVANKTCILSLKKRGSGVELEAVGSFRLREMGRVVLDESGRFCQE